MTRHILRVIIITISFHLLIILPCEAGAQEASNQKIVIFPKENIFKPLIADPFSTIPFFELSTKDGGEAIWRLGAGHSFGLVRLSGITRYDLDIQLNIEGAISSRFQTWPFIGLEDTDYIIGFPIDIGRGDWALRVIPTHTSSHLGDNLIRKEISGGGEIKSGDIKIISMEGIKFLLSHELNKRDRLYGGWGIANRSFDFHPRNIIEIGAELFTHPFYSGIAQLSLYLATDIQSKEEFNWNISLNSQAGVAIQGRETKKRLRIAATFFSGHQSEGQFKENTETRMGIGIFFDM